MSVTRIQNTGECLALGAQQARNHRPAPSFSEDVARASQTKVSASCHDAGVGAEAKCAAALAEFCEEVLRMKIVGGSDTCQPFGAAALLSGRADEKHPKGASFANLSLAHIILKVSSLDDLRAIYKRVVEKGIPIKLIVTHGCSFAVFVGGPCGNLFEIYWPTGDLSISGRPCPGETRSSDHAWTSLD